MNTSFVIRIDFYKARAYAVQINCTKRDFSQHSSVCETTVLGHWLL